MKVSEITIGDITKYLRLETGEYTEEEIAPLLAVAKQYVSNYTGIPITSTETTVKTLDDYEDFYIVIMILCQDMYDNRSMYIEKSNLNRVVDTILEMHCINLL